MAVESGRPEMFRTWLAALSSREVTEMMAARLAVRGLANEAAGGAADEGFLSEDELHAQFQAYQHTRRRASR